MLFAFCRLLLRFGLRLALALVSCYRLRLCPPRPCSSPPGLCLVRPPRRPPSCKTSHVLGHLFTVRACLHQPSTTTSATSSPPPRASTSGRTWQGHIWNLRSHRTKVHLRQSCRTRLGLQRQGLAVYLGPDEENDGHRQVLLCCNTKVPRRFRREKVSQEDAAFILAWLSDPPASKRAHSAVDLTADGLARPANCINDMRLASRASSRSNFLVLYCRCRLAVACAVGFEIVFCLPTS